MWECLWWRYISRPPVCKSRVINLAGMKGTHSAPQSDKVVTEGCSGAKGEERGGGLVLRGLLVQSARLFKFPSQCQETRNWSVCKAMKPARPAADLSMLRSRTTSGWSPPTRKPVQSHHHRQQCWITSFILRSSPLPSGCPPETQACGGVKLLYGTSLVLLTSVFGHENRVAQDHHHHRHTGYWSRQ